MYGTLDLDCGALQVTEKCPECGHMEAFSKEIQVCFRFHLCDALFNERH